jgi:hypothetical protein
MQSHLNRRWFHKVVDYFSPNNCRAKLERAICENKEASASLFCLIRNHENDVIAALKNDRRAKVHR